MDTVNEIYRLLPDSVALMNLSLSDGYHLTFQGLSNRNSDINDLQRAFVNSDYFDNVNLDYVNKRITQDGEVNYFKISCVIKDQGQANGQNQ